MSRLSDKEYLTHFQYADPTNLDARISVHALFSTGKEKWSDFIYRHLMMFPKAKFLALGCGNATQWQANSTRFPSDSVMHLSDLSHGMLKVGRSGLGEDTRFSFTLVDAQAIPYPGHIFDRVTANHMLYHVPEIPKSLDEIKRVLKPGGLFMAATNGEKHMIELYDFLTGLCQGYIPEDSKHTRFSLENGSGFLEQYFSHVVMIPYLSDLWVTDAERLVDYVFSMWDVNGSIMEDQYFTIMNHFRAETQQKGGIFIHKSTGIFLASDSNEIMRSIRSLQAE
jgi:ubiquinone/menaquinone biosynthesis C-methylase UbiE